MPPDALFSNKATTLEVQAVASWSLYTAGDPSQQAHMNAALDAWKRYHTHVSAAGRSELAAHAEERIGYIEDVQGRMP